MGGRAGASRYAAAINEKISSDVRKVLSSPDVQKTMVATGAVVDARGSKEWSAFGREEIATMRETVQKAGIKVE